MMPNDPADLRRAAGRLRNHAYLAVRGNWPVASALADLLEDVADGLDQDGGIVQSSSQELAVKAARAILEEES